MATTFGIFDKSPQWYESFVSVARLVTENRLGAVLHQQEGVALYNGSTDLTTELCGAGHLVLLDGALVWQLSDPRPELLSLLPSSTPRGQNMAPAPIAQPVVTPQRLSVRGARDLTLWMPLVRVKETTRVGGIVMLSRPKIVLSVFPDELFGSAPPALASSSTSSSATASGATRTSATTTTSQVKLSFRSGGMDAFLVAMTEALEKVRRTGDRVMANGPVPTATAGDSQTAARSHAVGTVEESKGAVVVAAASGQAPLTSTFSTRSVGIDRVAAGNEAKMLAVRQELQGATTDLRTLMESAHRVVELVAALQQSTTATAASRTGAGADATTAVDVFRAKVSIAAPVAVAADEKEAKGPVGGGNNIYGWMRGLASAGPRGDDKKKPIFGPATWALSEELSGWLDHHAVLMRWPFIPLLDLFAAYNIARGTSSAISPTQLLDACKALTLTSSGSCLKDGDLSWWPSSRIPLSGYGLVECQRHDDGDDVLLGGSAPKTSSVLYLANLLRVRECVERLEAELSPPITFVPDLQNPSKKPRATWTDVAALASRSTTALRLGRHMRITTAMATDVLELLERQGALCRATTSADGAAGSGGVVKFFINLFV